MKKLKLFCDPLTVAMASICMFFSVLFFPLFMAWAALRDPELYLYLPLAELILFWGFVALTYVFLASVMFYCIPQWFNYVVLDSEGITYCAPFRKKKFFSYYCFHYVEIAYYLHIYQNRYFLVLSRRIVPPEVLMNINHLHSDETTLKIKISKRRYEALLQLLPPYMKNKLQNACEGDEKTGFDINAALKRQAREQRRASRKKNQKHRKRK